MYAFGPIPKQKRSGRVVGTHQKIDRVARRHLALHLSDTLPFPEIKEILHFEGTRGPDGIKMKSPGRDEPWHFIDPDSIDDDDALLQTIADHSANLTDAIRKRDNPRASFEAAWMAHAITDGLTPAHHEPLKEQLEGMRATDHRKDKLSSKILMTGGSRKEFVQNNWKYWGVNGIMTTHTLFEAGVATTAKPLRFNNAALTTESIADLDARGFRALYIEAVREVNELDMYGRFKREGWTHTLAIQTSRSLLPIIIRSVTLAWYEAYQRALKASS